MDQRLRHHANPSSDAVRKTGRLRVPQAAVSNRALAQLQESADEERQPFRYPMPSVVRGALTSGQGRPLDAATRHVMERTLGADLADVRVHTDSGAAASAGALHAYGYAVGNHIVLGNTESDTSPTRHDLLVHELRHVVDQRRSDVPISVQCWGKSGFSAQEERWITDVWSLPAISLMFQAYGSVPQPVLGHVSEFEGSSAQGQTTEGEFVDISDTVYHSVKTWNAEGSSEAAFKSTLIHELFHFFEYQTQDVDPAHIFTPGRMIDALLQPGLLGFRPYEFGWFVHPRQTFWVHFDLLEGNNILNPLRLDEGDDVYPVFMDSTAWEHSPMPVSGSNISAEEDAAEILAMYLTSLASRKHLRQKYPLRHRLVRGYLGVLLAQHGEATTGVPHRAVPFDD